MTVHPEPDVERIVDASVAAVAAAAAGGPLPDPGDDPVARRVRRVVDAIAGARPEQPGS